MTLFLCYVRYMSEVIKENRWQNVSQILIYNWWRCCRRLKYTYFRTNTVGKGINKILGSFIIAMSDSKWYITKIIVMQMFILYRCWFFNLNRISQDKLKHFTRIIQRITQLKYFTPWGYIYFCRAFMGDLV